jgi:hypothetical protein
VSSLWHVSDDNSIRRFEPRANPSHDSPEALVWAIDDEHVPAYWFRPLWEQVIASTLEFSGIRLRNL